MVKSSKIRVRHLNFFEIYVCHGYLEKLLLPIAIIWPCHGSNLVVGTWKIN
jgi:hypothetical protein